MFSWKKEFWNNIFFKVNEIVQQMLRTRLFFELGCMIDQI